MKTRIRTKGDASQRSASSSGRFRLGLTPFAIAFSSAMILAGCGGGGGGGDSAAAAATPTPSPTPSPTPTPTPTPAPAPTPAGSLTMFCAEGAGWQCSGDVAVRTENGVTLSRSGVQVFGNSTSELKVPLDPATRFNPAGLTLGSGGFADIRVGKDASSLRINDGRMALSKLGITWDDSTERPTILEAFRTANGRVAQDSNGLFVFSALKAFNDIAFYDFATKLGGATQANYANNVYFPRVDPVRCPPPAPAGGFPQAETAGITSTAGDWNAAVPGVAPHLANAGRLHSDGDTQAGAANAAGGLLPGATGISVGCPGSTGYRVFDARNFRAANLVRWLSQDNVHIGQWNGTNERTQHRRGFAAFGAVTDPALVPTTGASTYTAGVFWGLYSADGVTGPVEVVGDASVTVNYGTRAVTLNVINLRFLTGGAPLPFATVTVATVIGTAGTANANYFTGPVTTGTGLNGGLSGRLFGDVTGAGATAGPAEIGTVLRAIGAGATPPALIGGFIARKS